jgi:toxin ParE1/3/4
MARIELAPEVLDDFDRIIDHLTHFEIENTTARISEITQDIQILTHSPLIGRPAKDGKCELVIGRGSHGYVALYRFVASIDTVFVLAIRNQRESGYKHQH